MLALRPNCEICDKDLAPDNVEAMICSYECTFCTDCVTNLLHNVCPNCGGGFVQRPIRPKNAWRPTTGLLNNPASTKRVHTPYSRQELQEFTGKISSIPPLQR